VDDARSAFDPDTGVAEIMLFNPDSQFIGEILELLIKLLRLHVLS
jgi:hypothetical protein